MPKTKNSRKQTNSKPLLILDTNIPIYLSDKKKLSQLAKVLSKLETKYEFTISAITTNEILKRGTRDIKETLEAINDFETFEVSKKVLIVSAIFIGAGMKDNELGDSIIAATAFLMKADILTANQKDFPEPFFNEKDCWQLKEKDDKRRTKTTNIYLLKINFDKCKEKFMKIEYIQERMNQDNY